MKNILKPRRTFSFVRQLKNISNILFIFLCCINHNIAQNDYCPQCPIEFATAVDQQGLIHLPVDITTSGVNDLNENPLSSVCITLNHDWLPDVFVALTSPGGHSYFLMSDDDNNYQGCNGLSASDVDICFTTGSFSPITMGDAYGNYCFGSNYTCFAGDYTVSCPQNSSASFSNIAPWILPTPSCDLNDFNTPGHPVAGTWTLTIGCVCFSETFSDQWETVLDYWEMSFLNNNDINTASPQCSPYEEISSDQQLPRPICREAEQPFITQHSEYLDIIPPPHLFQEKRVLLSDQGVVAGVTSYSFNADLYPPGQYEGKIITHPVVGFNSFPNLIGLDFAEALAFLEESDICPVVSAGSLFVEIVEPPSAVDIDIVLCPSECFDWYGTEICEDGIIEGILPASHSSLCDTLVYLNVSRYPSEAQVLAPVIEYVCPGETATLSASGGETYFWQKEGSSTILGTESSLVLNNIDDESAGNYLVSITTEFGCVYEKQVELKTNCYFAEEVLEVGSSTTLCFDSFTQAPNYCEIGNGVTSFTLQDNCIILSGEAAGNDLICLYIETEDGRQLLQLTVVVDRIDDNYAPIGTDWLLAPNPVSNHFYLKTPSVILDEIRLYHIGGKIIQKWHPTHQEGRYDLQDLPKGVYLICLLAQDELVTKKIVID